MGARNVWALLTLACSWVGSSTTFLRLPCLPQFQRFTRGLSMTLLVMRLLPGIVEKSQLDIDKSVQVLCSDLIGSGYKAALFNAALKLDKERPLT